MTDVLIGTDLSVHFAEVRAYTEELAAPLSAEDQMVQSMADVSPTKWHRAHTTWFFETFLLRDRPGYELFHPAYGYLFNSYYVGIGERAVRSERGLLSRPGIEEIAAYRRHVDQAMEEWGLRTLTGDEADLVTLGLHHEQQHQELLLMDIKHVLSRNPLLPAYQPCCPIQPSRQQRRGWQDVDAGLYEIGHEDDGFAFDNETPRHRVFIDAFSLATDLVTCGQWQEFIDDGGYRRPELWLSDGWATVTALGWTAPLYWGTDDSEFTLAGVVDRDPDRAVAHISYYEADAFARWAGARLPTEQEWEVAARPEADSSFGDLWQWTSSSYAPYPGFHPAAGAVGEYNGKFMVNQYVLRGSSCATPSGHARSSYRNFFPPSARWAFSGVRLAR